MMKILKIRKVTQNNCLNIVVHNVITQQTQDNTGSFPEGLLTGLTSASYRGPSSDSQRTNTKIFVLWLIDKFVF